ncbi:phosphoribosyl-ATP diphosphatase [Roseomonas sp. KE2513]|uniref:phosphoribosyl-ATP diphosphatase n=1 Tax=Roseomonas sp. KE2513 TaxID=2479202 RepID=UPI0018DF184B|nr:phosphoribosyl-ATP diphosphatase [Roseomonas sp. KE2513]MBI0535703.1 phosphoribosyl-ATP diphosphatase [Roseomonas sp. KE2513]
MGKAAKSKAKKPAAAEEAVRPRKAAAKAKRGPAKAKAGAAKVSVKSKAKAPKLKPAQWKEDLRVHKPLPVPADLADAPIDALAQPPKRVRRAEARHLAPLDQPGGEPVPAVLDRLWAAVEERRLSGNVETSHSARLLARGTGKVAQKLGEEAVETVIEAMAGNRSALVCESADLLYHLIVVWVDAGIRPEQVWAELVRREGISGIAEKAARQNLSAAGVVKAGDTTKLA